VYESEVNVAPQDGKGQSYALSPLVCVQNLPMVASKPNSMVYKTEGDFTARKLSLFQEEKRGLP
jgi:hypothetical protein